MMEFNKIVEKLNEILNDKVETSENGQVIFVSREDIVECLNNLKYQQGFLRLADITSADYVDRFEVVYHLLNDKAELLAIKVKLEKNDNKIPSVSSLWKAANSQEREIFDLMGIIFEGHPNLKRILCPDDFEGHPLQKSFKLNPVSRFKSN